MLRVPALLLPCVAALLATGASATTITSQTDVTPTGWTGVELIKLRTASPSTNAWVAYVDLCAPGVRIDATAATGTRRTAGSWAGVVGADLVVNGDFYRTSPKLRIYGQAAGGGSVWPLDRTGVDPGYSYEWFWEDFGWIAFADNAVHLNHTKWAKQNAAAFSLLEGYSPDDVSHAVPPGVTALVSGFPELVHEGVAHTCADPAAGCFPDRSDTDDRHPRTAMGLTEDRRTFILAVVDGRSSSSAGMRGAELAWLMAEMGAWVAFNLDGGGSTQMWAGGSYVNAAATNNGGSGARSVANHWGVFLGDGDASEPPAHCVDWQNEAVLGPIARGDGVGTTDLDGDGAADVCVRTAEGLRCATGDDFVELSLPSLLSDAQGWDDPTNWSTLRTGDLDGDGRADLCARANAGVRCWRSADAWLDALVVGPPLSDDGGWDSAAYASTLRLIDFDGDGRDDLCARAAAGMRCYPSIDDGFGPVAQTDRFANAAGFGGASNWGTLMTGDIDGDGRADACARGADGVVCYRSDDTGPFVQQTAGPAWSDASGWWRIDRWSTIQLVDVDHDGRSDLCARGASGLRCHLSEGETFGAAVQLGALTSDSGWRDPSNYSTLRFGDIDGDGDRDVCARADAGVSCWPWESGGWGDVIVGPPLSDATGWDVARRYHTLRLADVDGDGDDDLCARDELGIGCWLAEPGGFSDRVNGPAWGGLGFEDASVWGTLLLASRDLAPGAPGEDAGTPLVDDAGPTSDAGAVVEPEPGADAGSDETGAQDSGSEGEAAADAGVLGDGEFDGAAPTPNADPAGVRAVDPDEVGPSGAAANCSVAAGADIQLASLLMLLAARRRARRRARRQRDPSDDVFLTSQARLIGKLHHANASPNLHAMPLRTSWVIASGVLQRGDGD